MRKILVTGANGQLGRCIKDAAANFPDLQFVFVSKETLDIENTALLKDYFRKNAFTHCVNTAAYTNVEKAESEPEKAFAINAEAVKNVATVCKENDVVLLHISTDYVFDGKKESPYVETDFTNPINVYGASKLKGEQYITEICNKYFIFRTSWLYSQYGHNFLKTVLKYAGEGKPLTITTEQTGTPTNANDLAKALLQIVTQDSTDYGVYHFSNRGETTWFGFAEEILALNEKLKDANLAKTNHYRTFAARPAYSVLDNSKIENLIPASTAGWKKSLETIIKNLSVNQ
ncbi:dTDP-4-dehydrorhamnose reductase [Aequorivita antarctica]|uniref:dTDP-4-dehydrorhamnose reductase n=1 Tax=Aequorivita antarctica TaxID=153266 RepID=A0A5C6Z3W3_9FLAO|nr:dTDP-4-dehydrorhamnose reductase [Aequorivita antarctica]TXD74767.1 dTDP-4-dehydrorhamnose reductase [Aequorivita antarctica]SRX72530.1 dTDP-4-dehydrorhamnose reductase [Aequorivita antarctica]